MRGVRAALQPFLLLFFADLGGSPGKAAEPAEAPYSSVRRVLLLSYILSVAVITLVLVLAVFGSI